MASIYEELSWRGLVHQVSDAAGFQSLMAAGPQRVYAGFDPTASSLHIGNLVPLIALRRFQLAGHVPIAVMGGSTGLIGDPSGKSNERALNERAVVTAWLGRIREQVGRFIDLEARAVGAAEPAGAAAAAHLVDNYDWTAGLSVLDFLRDVGKHFSVNAMLAKDSVRSRLEREESGISYAEFSYMILQAYDFFHLAEALDCRVQVGGSDQWGNITAGIELIRRKLGRESFALTFPLITTASGAKFGKTERGTVWLDAAKTSPYAFYQFWINVDDRDVGRFLRYFTFLAREEIEALEEATRERPAERGGQRRLAAEMTRMTHGAGEVEMVERASRALFGQGDLAAVDERTLEAALESAPGVEMARGEEIPPLAGLLVKGEVARSMSEARRLVAEGGVYVNNRRVADPQLLLTPADFLFGRLLVLRRGKKSYSVIRLPADQVT
jgi:tyrosyl-tRNA synthetase